MIDPSWNYNQIVDELTATTDIFGNTLAVGDRARSFDFPMLVEKDFQDRDIGRIHGMGLKGSERYSYIEGTISAIGVCYPNQSCKAYAIKADVLLYGEHDEAEERKNPSGELVYAPVNGTPTLRSKTFGVVKIDPNQEKVLRRYPKAYIEKRSARTSSGVDFVYIVCSPISPFAKDKLCYNWCTTVALAWEEAEYLTNQNPDRVSV